MIKNRVSVLNDSKYLIQLSTCFLHSKILIVDLDHNKLIMHIC